MQQVAYLVYGVGKVIRPEATSKLSIISWILDAVPGVVFLTPRSVARICCKEGQSWKLGHGVLTVDFRAGCSSGSMT